MQFTKKEINSGANTSFWYEKWSPLGQLIELTGERGSMDLGIPKNATVENAVQIYRARGHRVHTLRMIGQEIMAVKNRGLNHLEDICLWKRKMEISRQTFSLLILGTSSEVSPRKLLGLKVFGSLKLRKSSHSLLG